MPRSTALLLVATAACAVSTASAFTSGAAFTRSSSALHLAKGFGPAKPEKVKSDGQVKREGESSRYDDIAASGGQEYSIFVRKFGSDDQSWFPCGSIAVPRGAQVSDAIFANVPDLKTAIVRTYPKLKGEEGEFEFGYNLKVYPDDPIEVAMKGSGKKDGPSISNWINNVLSPVDASEVKRD
eukprot:CAMPEP_0183292538 /NCGR_PEP_ID=MMETSP0160_2-20130417/1558_1 /TAXON_ID=2839 ORGANISM="Odontella Sinensis, Strain Grunow 1884" /NCGR_SAMPLE_ID=MMETSP0160_2 /ASSEMBLY_ACC=CAM_ASM_000250 /LENGTH=181 /DNA_ID=CAMNT_0025453503 /DNA_START=90 /DNA_END=635 /DNA_ORIENTATION=+